MNVEKAIKSRKSVRKYKSKKPDWRNVIECIDSARFAPMAGSHFSPRFIVVEEEKLIEKIGEATTQEFVSTAPCLIVVCSDTKLTKNAYSEKGHEYNKQQVGAAIQNILLSVEEKGMSSCWVGYFAEEIVKSLLHIPEDIELETIITVGYEKEKEKTRKEKIALERILFFEKYDERRKTPLKKIRA